MCVYSCDCCAREEKREGQVGEVRWDGGEVEGETYSSIQLIKIPLSKKPVKFRFEKIGGCYNYVIYIPEQGKRKTLVF